MPHAFFITGTGRSGTTTLAALLNTDPQAAVYHEPHGNEGQACIQAYCSEMAATAYIEKRREWIATHLNTGLNYGEVNGYLRFHADALRQAGYPVYQIIRDGRDVVRSGYSRNTYKFGHMTCMIEPKPGDLCFYDWLSMTRFERICWHWQMVNEYLADRVEDVLKFEDMIGNWEAVYWFTRQIGVDVDKETWKKKPVRNATIKHSLPVYDKWDMHLKDSFWRICGDTMAKFGYERR